MIEYIKSRLHEDDMPGHFVYVCPCCGVEEGKQHNGGCADQNPVHPDGLMVRRPT